MTPKTHHHHKRSIKLLAAILISKRGSGGEESTRKGFHLLESLAVSPWKTGHIDKKHFVSLKSKPLCLCLHYIMIPSQWPPCKFCPLPASPSNFTTAPRYGSELRDRLANNKRECWKSKQSFSSRMLRFRNCVASDLGLHSTLMKGCGRRAVIS